MLQKTLNPVYLFTEALKNEFIIIYFFRAWERLHSHLGAFVYTFLHVRASAELYDCAQTPLCK